MSKNAKTAPVYFHKTHYDTSSDTCELTTQTPPDENSSNASAIKKTRKNAKEYSCDICSFVTSNHFDYKRHLSTRKHISNVNAMKTRENTEDDRKKYICEHCDKTYCDYSGLWRHKKTCIPEPKNVLKPSSTVLPEGGITVELLLEIIKQNKLYQENQNGLIENTKGIIENHKDLQNFVINKLSEVTAQTINNNTNTNTNSHNRTFNLNVFLNEHCKDAINLTDFANALNVTVRDLERTGQLGFVGGITQIIADGLNELDVHTRPIHCTDLKRETVYVKEDGKWIKDEPKDGKDLPRFRTAVKKVANKNLMQLNSWAEENPRCEDMSSQESETYLHLSNNAIGGRNGEEEAKFENTILKNVMKKVTIDKDGVVTA